MAYFRTSVKAISPGFLRAGTGERYMYVIGLCMDALAQKMVEGQLARMPLKCAPAFLPIIGSDRLMPQGPGEPTESYRVRLQKAFEAWQIAGSARAILSQLLPFALPDMPRARVVGSRYSGNIADTLFVTDATNTTPIKIRCQQPINFESGDTVTIRAAHGNTAANGTRTITLDPDYPKHIFTLDGSAGNGTYTGGGYISWSDFPTTYPPDRLSSTWYTYDDGADTKGAPTKRYNPASSSTGANWDWDSLSQVAGSWGWWGSFVILYATGAKPWIGPAEWAIGQAGLTIGTLPGTVGTNMPRERAYSLQAIAGLWKAAQAWIRCIIVSFDDSLFDPGSPVGGGVNPDGEFGWWTKVVDGAYVPSRFENARYFSAVE